MFDEIRSAIVKPFTEGHDDEPDREGDVAGDPGVAESRATGGGPRTDGDSASTTGTGDSESFVGRVSGQDEGDVGVSGAEARATGDASER